MKKILTSIFAILFLGLLINCSSTQVQKPHIQREWMLIYFADFTKDQLIKGKANINLTSKQEGNEIKGSAYMGCNRMFFNAEFKSNGKVKISGLGSTKMACQNMSLENSFAQSFGKMEKYYVEGHFLTFTDERGNTMKFVAADWD